MIIKTYTGGKNGLSAQSIASWTGIWDKSESLLENSTNTEKDHLSCFLKKYFPSPPKKILDAGCGTGKYVIAYRKLGYDISGVDFSGDTINRIVKEMGAGFPVYEANIASLPFDDGYFDCYFSGGVIEHFEEGPGQVLQEARRVIKKGGRLLVTVPYINLIRRISFLLSSRKIKSDYLKIKVNRCGKEFDISKEYNFFEYLFDVSSLSTYFKSNNFIIERSYPTNLLWGEVGLLPRRFISSIRDTKNIALTGEKDTGIAKKQNRLLFSLKRNIYDFIITENINHILYKVPLAALNYLSGHLVLIVAKAI